MNQSLFAINVSGRADLLNDRHFLETFKSCAIRSSHLSAGMVSCVISFGMLGEGDSFLPLLFFSVFLSIIVTDFLTFWVACFLRADFLLVPAEHWRLRVGGKVGAFVNFGADLADGSRTNVGALERVLDEFFTLIFAFKSFWARVLCLAVKFRMAFRRMVICFFGGRLHFGEGEGCSSSTFWVSLSLSEASTLIVFWIMTVCCLCSCRMLALFLCGILYICWHTGRVSESFCCSCLLSLRNEDTLRFKAVFSVGSANLLGGNKTSKKIIISCYKLVVILM